MAVDRLRRHYSQLRVLAGRTLHKAIRKAVYRHGDADLISLIARIAHNIVTGEVGVDEAQRQYLVKHADWLHEFVDAKTLRRRRDVLQADKSLCMPHVILIVLDRLDTCQLQ